MWPESFGFSIHGNGPCYIIDVRDFGAAKLSGLKAGDKILQVRGEYPVALFASKSVIF